VIVADPSKIDIVLKLLSSNCGPLDDLQLVAKVITSNNVIIESKPSAMSTGNWTLVVNSDLWVNHYGLDFRLTLRPAQQIAPP